MNQRCSYLHKAEPHQGPHCATIVKHARPRARSNRILLSLLVVFMLCIVGCAGQQSNTFGSSDPLPSWNDGIAKEEVIEFVQRVTSPESRDYRPPAERIAVFDNDGTLWVEQPIYIQLAFTLDRLAALAPDHPEWLHKEPFKSALARDLKGVMAGGERALQKLILATHAGVTTEEFTAIVQDWIVDAWHPRFGQTYTDLAYQPMLELLDYLRANQFRTYIVSGGGVDFIRPWAEAVYGIPPEQVIGSRMKTEFTLQTGQPQLVRRPQIDFINDKAGKPVGIYQHIGRRPIAAFGNSDGDLAMLQWTAADDGSRFCLVVHHTDAAREWAYDRQSSIGRLDRALDEARARGWTVVNMRRDWKRLFAFEAY